MFGLNETPLSSIFNKIFILCVKVQLVPLHLILCVKAELGMRSFKAIAFRDPAFFDFLFAICVPAVFLRPFFAFKGSRIRVLPFLIV